MQVHIGEVVAQAHVVDGDALLTPQVMARIVSAVLAALKASQADERARQRDTHIGGGGGGAGGACCDAQQGVRP